VCVCVCLCLTVYIITYSLSESRFAESTSSPSFANISSPPSSSFAPFSLSHTRQQTTSELACDDTVWTIRAKIFTATVTYRLEWDMDGGLSTISGFERKTLTVSRRHREKVAVSGFSVRN